MSQQIKFIDIDCKELKTDFAKFINSAICIMILLCSGPEKGLFFRELRWIMFNHDCVHNAFYSSRRRYRKSEHGKTLAKSPIAIQFGESVFARELAVNLTPFQKIPRQYRRISTSANFPEITWKNSWNTNWILLDSLFGFKLRNILLPSLHAISASTPSLTVYWGKAKRFPTSDWPHQVMKQGALASLQCYKHELHLPFLYICTRHLSNLMKFRPQIYSCHRRIILRIMHSSWLLSFQFGQRIWEGKKDFLRNHIPQRKSSKMSLLLPK